MTAVNEHCWVDGCKACGPDAVPGAVCPFERRGHFTYTQLTPEEQARRDRVTAAITKFQSKPAKPPRRWRR